MDIVQLVVIAIVQGVTEFLPISSSGHLALIGPVAGWPDQGVVIDVAVHVGTLGAVIVYFWRELFGMLAGVLRSLTGQPDERARYVLYLAAATVPVAVAGGLAEVFDLMPLVRNPAVIGWTMLGFGVVLYLVDKVSAEQLGEADMTFKRAMAVGFWQVLALIPGTSRAGITMTGARMMGFSRVEAARFSMLLSIPTIIAAGTLEGLKLAESGNSALGMDALIAGALAFATALVAIAGLLRWVKSSSFTPFVVYRSVIGIAILVWVYV